MDETREPLTFKRPGAAGDPANVVILTTVQIVDASGVQVDAGTGRTVIPYDGEALPLNLTEYAQAVCDGGLTTPFQVAMVSEGTEAETFDPAALTKDGLKALLDEKGIEYKASATKDELLALLPPSR